MTPERRARRRLHIDLGDAGDRRGASQSRSRTDEAAIERIVQRIGKLSEFSDAQIRQIAAITLVAAAVDDTDRQRRDDAARENRTRIRALGRE